MSYLSQGEAYHNHEDMRFKKSPIKYIPYEITQSDFKTPSHPLLPTHMGEFDNLRKVSDKAASLRQTINSQTASSLFNRTQAPTGSKPPQFSDFLRQTMNSRPAIGLNNTYNPDSGSSKAMQWNKEEKVDVSLNYRNPEQLLPAETKSTHLLDNTSSLKQYEKLSEKIDKNKKMIEELRKNSHHEPTPQYLEPKVYQKRYGEDNHLHAEQDANGFKKTGENKPYLTPKIDKATFESRFDSSPLIDQRKKLNQSAKSANLIQLRENKGKLQNHTHYQSLSVSDFAVGRKLGEGKFGIVNMVVHRITGGFFALKKIQKSLIKSNMMIEQLSLEVRLQSCLSHRNILSMYGFFDDSTQFYIVLEYMEGGTLFQKLKKESRLSQAETSRCMFEMVEAVEYLHDLGIAHRDIKPQNIVISNNVYKLCDFGWATLCNERRKTYCGTFDYVAPEILEGEEYDMAVDLWCLGVLAFELLTGKAPFYNISRKQTMKKILNVDHQILKYPEEISRDAKDFIDKLVRKDPNERMKANEALLHPFLKKYQED